MAKKTKKKKAKKVKMMHKMPNGMMMKGKEMNKMQVAIHRGKKY